MISHGVLIPWTTITYAHGERELDITFQALQHAMRKVHRIISEALPVETTFTGPPVKPVFRKFNRCMQSVCGRVHKDAPRLACCERDG